MKLTVVAAGVLFVAAQASAGPLPKQALGRPIERALHYFATLGDGHVLGEPEFKKIIADWREHKRIENPISEERAAELQRYQYHRDGIDSHLRDPAVQADGARIAALAAERLAQLESDTAQQTAAQQATSLPYPQLDFVAVAPGRFRFHAEFDHQLIDADGHQYYSSEPAQWDGEVLEPFDLQTTLVTNRLYRSVMAFEDPNQSVLLQMSLQHHDLRNQGELPPLDDDGFWNAPLRVHLDKLESSAELQGFFDKLNAADPMFMYRPPTPEERQHAFGTRGLSLPTGDPETVQVYEVREPELGAPYRYDVPAWYSATRLRDFEGERYAHAALGDLAAGVRLRRARKPGAPPRAAASGKASP
jgi:formylglycine-generating enzyme required for sulfatase activity